MNEAELRQMLENFIGKNKPTILATVVSVDEGQAVCDIDDDGKAYYNVRLSPLAGANNGIIAIPKIGSSVLAVQIESSDDFMIIACSEYDKYIAKIGDVTIVLSGGNIVINGGENGGLVLLEAILSAINRIEDKLKDHQHGYIPYPAGVAGAPVPTTSAISLGDTTLVFDNTTRAELENTAIKQ